MDIKIYYEGMISKNCGISDISIYRNLVYFEDVMLDK